MRALVCCAVLAGAPLTLSAQTGVIAGTVRDSSRRPLPNALVQALGTGVAATTDSTGAYRLVVNRGVVVVRVELIGFGSRVDSLRLDGDSVQHDVTLAAFRGVPLNEVPLPPPTMVNDTTMLGAVVVTGAKRSQLLDQSFTSVAVMESEQLAARAVNTIDEAIDKAPAVLFLNGQVNIRGSTGYVQGLGSRVLLLVDGVPANQGDRGGINWDLVPVGDVDRVEIVKGAGSALYGSAALGGVINLITRDIEPGTHARVRATAGAYADPPHPEWEFRDDPGLLQHVDAFVSHSVRRVAASVNGSYQHSGGYREQDERERWSVGAKTRWQSSDVRTTVDLSGAWTQDAYDVTLLWCTTDGCDTQGQAYQPYRVDRNGVGDRTVSNKGYVQALVRGTPSERLQWQARGSWLRTHFTDYHQSGDDDALSNRYGLEMRGVVAPPGQAVITTVGVEATHADVESNIFTGVVDSNVFAIHTQGEYAAFGESELHLGSTRLTAGARIDFLTVDGGSLTGVLSPRVGAVFDTPLGATRISAGRGFRAPSLAERFVSTFVAGFRVIPNPGLQPETAWSVEVGQHVRRGVFDGDAAVFWTETYDLIEPVADQLTLQIQFQNVLRARLAGVDLTALVAPWPRFTTSLNYMFLSAIELGQNGQASQPLAFRPKHLVTLTADYALGFATVGADFRFVSRMERVTLFENDTRLAAKVLDLRATVTRGSVSGRLLATNVLNYIHNMVPRTLAPVRTVSLTLSWEY